MYFAPSSELLGYYRPSAIADLECDMGNQGNTGATDHAVAALNSDVCCWSMNDGPRYSSCEENRNSADHAY